MARWLEDRERLRDAGPTHPDLPFRFAMPFEPRVLRRCLRLDEPGRRAWTFADLLRAPDGQPDAEAFDALYDAFCESVGSATCSVTNPDGEGRIWFAAHEAPAPARGGREQDI